MQGSVKRQGAEGAEHFWRHSDDWACLEEGALADVRDVLALLRLE